MPLPFAEIVYEHLLAARMGERAHEDWSVLADFVTQAETGAAVAARAGRTSQ
jgi:hypothetical protein